MINIARELEFAKVVFAEKHTHLAHQEKKEKSVTKLSTATDQADAETH